MTKILTTREDPHSVRAEAPDHPEVKIQRGKKAVIALGKLALQNRKLFNIHEPGVHDQGVEVLFQPGRRTGHFAFIKDLSGMTEYGESVEFALGELIKNHQERFNVHIEHAEK